MTLTTRKYLFCFFIGLPAVFPLILLIEFVLNDEGISFLLIRFIVSSSETVVGDIATFGEITPAALATAIAWLTPRPIKVQLALTGIFLCAVGYFLYLTVSSGMGTLDIPSRSENSFSDWIDSGLRATLNSEGDQTRTLEQARSILNDIIQAARIFFAVISFALFGFILNRDGRNEEV